MKKTRFLLSCVATILFILLAISSEPMNLRVKTISAIIDNDSNDLIILNTGSDRIDYCDIVIGDFRTGNNVTLIPNESVHVPFTSIKDSNNNSFQNTKQLVEVDIYGSGVGFDAFYSGAYQFK